ncbi:MAG: hypothetical protein AAGJ93_10075 [Bacteroidota bacterium]
MHDIEPYFAWRNLYQAAKDEHSPFFGRTYSEFEFSQTIYNYYIHPQWDNFGSATLYAKILFADYDEHYAIIELIGEWNDAINNDSMLLKRELADVLIEAGISRFIFVCENVLNFHADDDSYYEEWYDDLRDDNGWVVLLNLQPHVSEEMRSIRIDNYLHLDPLFSNINWRPHQPKRIYEAIEGLIQQEEKRIY